jgi:ribosome assembly protein YihI (activator of Der GTPase)
MRANDVTLERLRALVDRRPEHGKVLSLFFDLDPTRFATADARLTEVHSLIDDLGRRPEIDQLDHDARVAVRDDIERLRNQLEAEGLPADGAQAIAAYASGPADLLEFLKLPRSVPSRAYLDDAAHVAPIADLAKPAEPWLAVLVSHGAARFLYGRPEALEEDASQRVHRDEFDREDPAEVDRHLRSVAASVDRMLHAGRWEHLVIGAPKPEASGFARLLSDPSRRRLAGSFNAEVEHVSADRVRDETTRIAREREEAELRELLDRYDAGLAHGKATGGWDDTRLMLVERRVEALLLGPDVDAEEEARMALGQDAIVRRVTGFEIGALLRF